LKEASGNVERELLSKQVQVGGSTGTSNKREDMLFRAKLEVAKTVAKVDLKDPKGGKRQANGTENQTLQQSERNFSKGSFCRFSFQFFLFSSFYGSRADTITDIGLAL
jgi:hypothetical protein